EMVDAGDITVDNPNAPANQNLKIFNKPFPNHSSNSNTNQDILAKESVHEIHAVFDTQPKASIEKILNQAFSLTQEPEPPLPSSSQSENVPLPMKELTAQTSLPIDESSYTTSLQDCERMLSNLSISQTPPFTALAAQEG
ncbi:hypothetical protein KI387_018420, partial [Taxus chinensis]